MFIDARREGAKMGKDQRVAQVKMVEKAEAWTTEQAERLGITPKEILDAVKRGWLTGMIKHLPASQVGDLMAAPLCSDAYGKLREQIRTAEVKPIRKTKPPPPGWNDRLAHGVHEFRSGTMADAFERAAAAE